MLKISNTSNVTALDESKLFRRFSKPGVSQDGIGLGLAIVKQVANVSGLDVSYEFSNQQHHFILNEKNIKA